MQNSILNPDAEVALSTGDKVTVKLLRWKAALEFFDKLKEQFKAFVDEAGNFRLDQSKLMNAIQGNAELLEWLVKECTGDQVDLTEINLGDMAKLSTKALEINLGAVASEIKNVKGRLAALAITGAPAEGVQPNKSSPTSPASASA